MTTKYIRTPRHMAATPVLNRIRSGSGLQDYLNLLNKDGVEEWFDDFEGDLIADEWAESTGTGGAGACASSLLPLATTASDNKGAPIIGSAGWMAGKGAMIQARFAPSTVDCKIEFGFVDADPDNETGAVDDIDGEPPTWDTTPTDAILFVYDKDDARTTDAWCGMSKTATTPQISFYGTGVANAANDAAATSYTVNDTLVVNSLTGQPIFVPAYATGTDRSGQFEMLVTSNTANVCTGHWRNGLIPPDDLAYSYGNLPSTLGVPVAAEYHTYTIKLEPNLDALFYVDGVFAGRITDAVTAATTSLCPWVEVVARAAAGLTLYVDYVWCVQSRRA